MSSLSLEIVLGALDLNGERMLGEYYSQPSALLLFYFSCGDLK